MLLLLLFEHHRHYIAAKVPHESKGYLGKRVSLMYKLSSATWDICCQHYAQLFCEVSNQN